MKEIKWARQPILNTGDVGTKTLEMELVLWSLEVEGLIMSRETQTTTNKHLEDHDSRSNKKQNNTAIDIRNRQKMVHPNEKNSETKPLHRTAKRVKPQALTNNRKHGHNKPTGKKKKKKY